MPQSDCLRQVTHRNTNYRMLYFFHGRATAALSHGVVKEDRVPPSEIGRAAERKRQFDRDPTHLRGGLTMPRKKAKTTDAIAIIHRRHYAHRPERETSLQEERANAEIARKIYDLRKAAGLSQRALAHLIGTTALAICRLEDADYEGHSLAMLQRIAAAVNKRVEIRFVPRQAVRPTA